MKNLVAALTLRFVDRLSGPSRGAASAIGQLNRAQEMGKAASKQWSAGLDQLDTKLNRLASASLITEGIGRAGEAMMRPLRGASAVARSYEHQLVKIGDTADLSARQLGELNRKIMETSRLGRAPTKVAGMADIFVAGGMDSVTAGNLLTTTTKVSIGQGVEESTAAQAAMAFNQSLKVSAEQMEGAFDAAAKSAKEGRFELKAMAQYLPIIGAVGANRGLTGRAGVSELTAALTAIMDKTQDEARSADQLKDLLLKADAEQTATAFRKFGVDVVAGMEAARRSGKSPIDAILDLTAQAQGNGARLNQLFTDQEAQLGLQALRDGRDRFNEVRDAANKAGAVVETSYRRMRATGQEKQEAYASAMERLGVSVGTILAPAVSLAADAFGKVADWMSKASEKGGLLGKAAVWAFAGLAGLAVGAGMVGHAVMGILAPLFIAKTLMGDMGGAAMQAGKAKVIGAFARMRMAAIAFNLSMLANPVVLGVVAAVAAVALIAVVVRKYWQPIKAFFGGVGQALGEAFGPALSAIGGALRPLKPLWDAVAGAVGGFFGWLGRLMQPMQATKGQLDGATNAGRQFGRMFVMAFNLTPIGIFARGIMAAFRFIRGAMNWRPVETLRGAWSSVSGFFTSLTSRFNGFGRMIMQGLIAGVRAMLGEVSGAVVGVANGAVARFKGVLGIKSPSRVFAALGGYTMEGLTQGLSRGGRSAVGQVAAVGGALVAALPGATAGPIGSAMPAVLSSLAAPTSAAPAGRDAGRGGVQIDQVTIQVTIPAGTDAARQGASAGRAAADAFRARLFDGLD